MALGSACPASLLCGSPHPAPQASTPPDSCARLCPHSHQAPRCCHPSGRCSACPCPHLTTTPCGSQRNGPASKEHAFNFNLRHALNRLLRTTTPEKAFLMARPECYESSHTSTLSKPLCLPSIQLGDILYRFLIFYARIPRT